MTKWQLLFSSCLSDSFFLLRLSTFLKEGVLKSKTYLLKVDESAKTPRVDGERVPLALLGALDIFCLFIYSLEVSHRAASAKITT